jgi:hypothetical protein
MALSLLFGIRFRSFLLNFYNVVRFPCLLEEGLKRAVQAEEGEPALPWQRLYPILVLTLRRLRTKVDEVG